MQNVIQLYKKKKRQDIHSDYMLINMHRMKITKMTDGMCDIFRVTNNIKSAFVFFLFQIKVLGFMKTNVKG